jgi:hypothetical protein
LTRSSIELKSMKSWHSHSLLPRPQRP